MLLAEYANSLWYIPGLALIAGLLSAPLKLFYSVQFTQSGKRSTGSRGDIMGRFIAFLLFLVLVTAVIWGLGLVARQIATRRRQRLAAEFAPDLLRYEDLPKPVVEAFIEQRKQLDAAHTIMAQMVGDPFFDLTNQYHNLITSWLRSQKKEIK